jgi:hypothetical protein
MKMSQLKLTEKRLQLGFGIILIITPLLLVTLFPNYAILTRIIFMGLLVLAMPALLLGYSLGPNYLFKKRNGETHGKSFLLFMRIFGLLFGISLLYFVTLPTLEGITAYAFGTPLVMKVDIPVRIEGGVNGSFIIGLFVNFQSDPITNDSYLYWFPTWYPYHLQYGHRYQFTILPGSKLILKAEPI